MTSDQFQDPAGEVLGDRGRINIRKVEKESRRFGAVYGPVRQGFNIKTLVSHPPRELSIGVAAKQLENSDTHSGLLCRRHHGRAGTPTAPSDTTIPSASTRTGTVEDWSQSFGMLGYRREGDLSSGHHFFKRDVDGVRTHKLHICRVGHPQIARMLRFRDHLRQHAADRLRYQELKLRLERENTHGIQEYLTAKDPFIRAILASID